MTPEERQKIYEEERVRKEAQDKLKQQDAAQGMKGCLIIVLICLAIGVGFALWPSSDPEPPQKSAAQQNYKALVAAGLKKQDVAMPTSLELNDSGWLVAVYQEDGFDRLSAAEREIFAERLVLAIRNGIYDKGVTTKYRVTLLGKSPGPGLARQLGSGRFIEGAGFSFDAK